MASTNRTEAVDMRRMNAQYGSAAPQRQPQRQPQRRPDVQRPKVVRRDPRELRAEERASRRRTTKALVLCMMIFAVIAFQIYSQVQVDELDRQLNDINSQIEVAESENVRLSMQLDSIISLDKVDDYAQNVLGMVKVENYQITYIDLSGEDAVTQSGGKTHQTFVEKIKSHF